MSMVIYHWISWPRMAAFILTLGYLRLLAAAGRADRKTRRIPNRLSLTVLLCSVCWLPVSVWLGMAMAGSAEGVPFCQTAEAVMQQLAAETIRHILGALLLSLPLLAADLIRPGSFGGGDIKLSFAGGFFLTMREAIPAMALSFGGAALAAAAILVMRRLRPDKGMGTGLPLGPFLALGLGLQAVMRLWHLFQR